MRQDAVEVVRLDLHSLGHLSDRDPGLFVHELQRFLCSTTRTGRTPPTPGRDGGLCRYGTLWCAGGRPLCQRAGALQCIERVTDLRVLFDERFELPQALLQAAADLAQNVSHTGLLVAVVSRRDSVAT